MFPEMLVNGVHILMTADLVSFLFKSLDPDPHERARAADISYRQGNGQTHGCPVYGDYWRNFLER